jgi:nickel superoxide dismutase
MKRLLMMTVLILSAAVPMGYLAAHCEVPCGIYDDGARFKSMMEDQTTIAKAIDSIAASADAHDATGHNQLARWVATKESHATNIQHTIAQYFMTQRNKADDAKYVKKLSAAHVVMVAAMKCKQTADPATAKALDSAIHDFQHAYGAEH